MKTYYIDTNVILRLFLKDDKDLSSKAFEYFNQARNGKTTLVIIPEILFEVEHVLRKLYKVSQEEISNNLFTLLKTPYIICNEKQTLLYSLKDYQNKNIGLVDCYLFHSAKANGAEVLSFDKDLQKL
jgi:predicted nucleic-acid-binding protein